MSTKVELNVSSETGEGEKTVSLKSLNYSVNQRINETGKPMSQPNTGIFTCSFEATEDSYFTEWIVNKSRKSGSVIFRNPNGMIQKKIEFTDGMAIDLSENMKIASNIMIAKLTFTTGSIKTSSGLVYEKSWKLAAL